MEGIRNRRIKINEMAGAMEGNKNAETWTEERVLELGNEMMEWFREDGNVFWKDFFVRKHGLYADVRIYLKKKFAF